MEKCNLCPRHCGADREKKPGFCSAGAEIKAALADLHFWEEPVISGSNGSGAVFFSGCSLKCVYCQNFSLSRAESGRKITTERLAEIFDELAERGAHNINLVTGTQFAPQIIEALKMRHNTLPVVWNSSGYETVETLKMLEGYVNIYLPDMKYSDAELALKYSRAADYFEIAKAAVTEMQRQTEAYALDGDGLLASGTVIRHLVLPDEYENTRGVIDWVADKFSKGDVLFSLMGQYVPAGDAAKYEKLSRRLTPEEYEWAKSYCRASGITEGFTQELSSADTVYIPDFNLRGL